MVARFRASSTTSKGQAAVDNSVSLARTPTFSSSPVICIIFLVGAFSGIASFLWLIYQF